jgi:hypothetical protein
LARRNGVERRLHKNTPQLRETSSLVHFTGNQQL